jgi:hypothetical protein
MRGYAVGADMPMSRRHTLAVAVGGLAVLAGCSGSSSSPTTTQQDGGTTTQTTAEPTAEQVPTTDSGPVVRVVNNGVQIHTVRVEGVPDAGSASLPPGGTSDIGTLYAPVNGEIAYHLVVYVDVEEVGKRDVNVAADTDLTRIEVSVDGDDISWNEVRGTA